MTTESQYILLSSEVAGGPGVSHLRQRLRLAAAAAAAQTGESAHRDWTPPRLRGQRGSRCTGRPCPGVSATKRFTNYKSLNPSVRRRRNPSHCAGKARDMRRRSLWAALLLLAAIAVGEARQGSLEYDGGRGRRLAAAKASRCARGRAAGRTHRACSRRLSLLPAAAAAAPAPAIAAAVSRIAPPACS